MIVAMAEADKRSGSCLMCHIYVTCFRMMTDDSLPDFPAGHQAYILRLLPLSLSLSRNGGAIKTYEKCHQGCPSQVGPMLNSGADSADIIWPICHLI